MINFKNKIRLLVLLPAMMLMGACVDTTIDTLDTIPQDVQLQLSSRYSVQYEPARCYNDLVFEYDLPASCDDQCCWWDLHTCDIEYCNDDPIYDCDWKLMVDSCR